MGRPFPAQPIATPRPAPNFFESCSFPARRAAKRTIALIASGASNLKWPFNYPRLETLMFNPRYIVVNQEFGWRIVQGGRRFPEDYPSKTQAICSAIAFAEHDGNAGRRAEVLVQHEDGRFVIEWVFGQDPRPDKGARPIVTGKGST
jgi:hypothetical protein